MRSAANSVHFRRNASPRQYEAAARTVLAMCGALISILGLVLAIGGLLSPFDGSAFYLLTGVGLIVSGALFANRNRAGAWTYSVVFVATLTWALRNVDQGPSLAQRLAGPAILLVMLAILMQPLTQWRPRRAAIAFASIMLVTVGIGISSTANGPLARQTAAVTRFLDSGAKGVLQ
jgi:glucose dehydrogenase